MASHVRVGFAPDLSVRTIAVTDPEAAIHACASNVKNYAGRRRFPKTPFVV
jgi:hypothetical protein